VASYSAFADGGAELGITPDTFARVTALPVVHGDKDVVLVVPSYFSLGFLRPGPTVFFGSSQRTFGAPGAGGSFGFADPDSRLGFAYVMNKLDFYLKNDPREKALRDAIYRAIARLTDRPGQPRRCASLRDDGHAIRPACSFRRHFPGDLTSRPEHKQGCVRSPG
jgi:CubicO group peptidase (beta-lactamase class C family)